MYWANFSDMDQSNTVPLHNFSDELMHLSVLDVMTLSARRHSLSPTPASPTDDIAVRRFTENLAQANIPEKKSLSRRHCNDKRQ